LANLNINKNGWLVKALWNLSILLIPAISISCYCITKDVENEIKQRDLVAVGKILSADTLEVFPSAGVYRGRKSEVARVKVFVNEVYKGSPDSDTIYLFTNLPGGSCGKYFELDSMYIIYSSFKSWKSKYPKDYLEEKYKVYNDSIYWISICYRTRLYNDSEIAAIKVYFKN
jgi:hypothetical protein